jgi:hypothetical protein
VVVEVEVEVKVEVEVTTVAWKVGERMKSRGGERKGVMGGSACGGEGVRARVTSGESGTRLPRESSRIDSGSCGA